MGKVLEKTREKTTEKLKEPDGYQVILLNDNYTTMDFVVVILVEVFHKKVEDAYKLMQEIHKSGKGTAGIYTWDIAVTKAQQVHSLAEANGFPLKCLVESI